MVLQPVIEKWPAAVSAVTIGAVKSEGGSRVQAIHIGGQNTLPLLFKEGQIPNPPKIAFEVWDMAPSEWPDELLRAWGKVINDPFKWAECCVKEHKAELICVKLQSFHPDYGNKDAAGAGKFIKELLRQMDVPLIITGCGDDAKDNQIIPVVSEAAKGERCLIGSAVQENYKTLVASVLADGHNIIAESPIDVNIAKQLNILISDIGLGLERIVMNPTIGALGYGLEYAYSIMERARLAALSGDKTLASPFICFSGQEAWRAKEAKLSAECGTIWETITSSVLIQAGADILVMRHPAAAAKVARHINNLFGRT
ncbi:MAG: acetyl-CoA decarbonylase/synthase complex subunit delta [Candidatus Omnitrophota bacterium]